MTKKLQKKGRYIARLELRKRVVLVNFKPFYRFNAFTLKHGFLLIIDTEFGKGNRAYLHFDFLVQKHDFFFKNLFLTKIDELYLTCINEEARLSPFTYNY